MLTFESKVVELGEVSADEHHAPFSFTVTGGGRVEYLLKGCACTTAELDESGEKITGAIDVTLAVRPGFRGRLTKVVKVTELDGVDTYIPVRGNLTFNPDKKIYELLVKFTVV